MKKITTLLFTAVTAITFAQTTSYNIEIERDATNSNLFTVFAVPDAAETDVDFVAGVILFKIATGHTIANITSLTGTGWDTDVDIITANLLTDAGLGDGTKDVVSLLSDVGQTIFSHNSNERFPLVSFETEGSIEFIESSDQLITAINSFSYNLGNAIIMNFGGGTSSIDRYGALVGETSFINTVLSTEDFNLSKTAVYPTPVIDTINIKTANITIDSAEIYDISGALVKTIDTNAIENTIDISELNSGVYFLKLTAGNANNTMKLIKL